MKAYAVSSLQTVNLPSGALPFIYQVQINIYNVILLHYIHLQHYNFWLTEQS